MQHLEMYYIAKAMMDNLYELFELEIAKPTILIMYSESDSFCGMVQFTDLGDDTDYKIGLVLSNIEIGNLAEVDNIHPEQALFETVYHEFIHIIQFISCCSLDHEGEIWDNMIDAGLEQGFIHRREI